jgi:prepilin-type processing-associated H-X9-DG protein
MAASKDNYTAGLYHPDSKTGPGHSYEVSGFMNASIRKTQTSMAGYIYHNDLSYTVKGKTLLFKLKGQLGSPCNIWIMYDGDDGVAGSNNDYPDAIDNHGADGGNVIFCDGHAEWTPASRYAERFAFGTEIQVWGASK